MPRLEREGPGDTAHRGGLCREQQGQGSRVLKGSSKPCRSRLPFLRLVEAPGIDGSLPVSER